jgi:hypothetical protein
MPLKERSVSEPRRELLCEKAGLFSEPTALQEIDAASKPVQASLHPTDSLIGVILFYTNTMIRHRCTASSYSLAQPCQIGGKL